MRKLLLATTALLALSAAPASADTVLTLADAGKSGTGTFDGNNSGTPISSIHASLTLKLDSVTAATNTWFFSYSMTNTTELPWTASLGSFGFNINPDIVFANSGVGSGSFFDKKENGSISGGVHVEFCATAGSNCSGTSAAGLAPGATGTGTFFLDFADSADAFTVITISDWTVRYQQIACLNPALCGNVSGGSGIGTSNDVFINPTVGGVPEPSTWAMMLLGFVGVGLFGMRRKARSTPFRMVSA